MPCTEEKPCNNPVLRWVHSKACRAERRKFPNEDVLEVRLEQSIRMLRKATRALKAGDYRVCAINMGTASGFLLEAIHHAYDCASIKERH
jgi:uncharacterized protein involved in exopolysaccharide biosynthesis